MTQISKDAQIVTQQIPHTLRLSAAERLVATSGRREAAKRLIASAPEHGIDLDLMWGVIDPQHSENGKIIRQRVRQVVLAVLGTGRTAMLFLSNPEQGSLLGSIETQTSEISASIRAALAGLRRLAPDHAALAQTLIEPDQGWAKRACIDGGMISVGRLDYMRMPISAKDLVAPIEPNWPPGIEVRPIRTLDPNSLSSDRQALIEALEGSYLDTLDCPELCGMRTMEDVVDSHVAAGEYDPTRWYLVFKDAQPAGCCLLTHCPQNNSVELVYLGIAPQARGLGLGRSLLAYSIARLGSLKINEITCAVDDRNIPAIRIYESLGFERFDARCGFVAPILPSP